MSQLNTHGGDKINLTKNDMMLIDNKYEIKQEVYLKTDSDQHLRIITSINIRQGRISYELSCGQNTSWHDDFEITKERDLVRTTSN